ncbi:MAG: Lrp/AsnC ligand binding domain-containing protein [Nitrosarchaeum sp.]|nr:Lrp/AsnC ligand binding domain-containing protein [Nitrosarchaeum sp.]
MSGEYVCRNCKTGLCKTNAAYVLITCNDGKLEGVMAEIGNLDNIKEVQETCGAYDIIAKIESITSKQLEKFIVHKIRNLANVRSAMTLHCKPTM